MSEFKVGDVVGCRDGSYSVVPLNGQYIASHMNRDNIGGKKRFTVLGVDCKLPLSEEGEAHRKYGVKDNDTIVTDKDGCLIFCQEKFLDAILLVDHADALIEKWKDKGLLSGGGHLWWVTLTNDLGLHLHTDGHWQSGTWCEATMTYSGYFPTKLDAAVAMDKALTAEQKKAEEEQKVGVPVEWCSGKPSVTLPAGTDELTIKFK